MAKAKSATKQAKSADVDEILGEDDVLAPAAPKAAKKAKPPAKGKKAVKEPANKKEPKAKPAKEAKPKADDGEGRSAQTSAVRAMLSKVRKYTSYADLAESTGHNLRLIRRTSRAMREAGEVETTREGTAVFVRATKK